MRQTPQSAVAVQAQQQQQIQAKEQAQQQIQQQEQAYQDYLKTPQGIKQYATETGQVQTTYGKAGVGSGKGASRTYTEIPTTTITYTSPYGTITESDTSQVQQAEMQTKVERLAKAGDINTIISMGVPATQAGELVDYYTKGVGAYTEIKGKGTVIADNQGNLTYKGLTPEEIQLVKPPMHSQISSGFFYMDIPGLKVAQAPTDIPKLSLREATKGLSLLGGVSPTSSVTGILDYTANKAQYLVPQPISQSLSISDVPPYVMRGSGTLAFAGTPILTRKQISSAIWSGISPEEAKKPDRTWGDIYSENHPGEIKKPTSNIYEQLLGPETTKALKVERYEQQKLGAKQTVYTAPYIAAEFVGGPIATTASALYIWGNAEQLFTPKGKATIQENIKQGESPFLAYGLPTAGIVLGAIGLRQSYMQQQLKGVQKASLKLSQPTSETYKLGGWKSDKEYQDFFSQQISTSKLIQPGLPHVVSSDLPTLRVFSRSEIIGSEAGGFISSGTGRTAIKVFDPFKMSYVTKLSEPYPIGGEYFPGKIAKFQGKEYSISMYGKTFAGAKPNKIYAGEYDVATNTFRDVNYGPKSKIFRETFGGIVTSETGKGFSTKTGSFSLGEEWGKEQNLRIISGPAEIKAGYPDKLFVKPKNLGFVYPEIDITPKQSFFKPDWGKKAQTSLVPQIFKPSSTPYVFKFKPAPVFEFVPVTKVSGLDKTYITDVIGESIGSIGKYKFPDFFQVPLINIPLTTNKPVQTTVQLPKLESKIFQISTPTIITTTIPKTFQIPTTTTSSTSIVTTIPIQTPIQIPKQIQTPVQIPKQTTIQFQTPSSASFTFNPPSYFWYNQKPKRKILPSKPTLNKGELTVEFRRRGKFFPIAKTINIGTGIAIGKSAARQTLGASFRIRKPTGELFSLQPSQEFRLGKTPGTLVQRSIVRLTSGSERREIAASRRTKGLTVYPKGKSIFGMPIINKKNIKFSL